MRLGHFEALRPICPRCLVEQAAEVPLRIAVRDEEEGDVLVQGMLTCTSPACGQEFPVLDGIPILVPKLAEFIQNNFQALIQRRDLSPTLQGILGDCAGAGGQYEFQRQYESTYTYGHYGDLDPGETEHEAIGSAIRLQARGLDLAGPWGSGPGLDVGCAVGRTTFTLAERADGPVVGIDLNIPMLQVAQEVLRHGRVRYGRRRMGLVYDARAFDVDLPHRERVDFWAADVLALPFPRRTVALATSLNVLDCAASPRDHLVQLGRVLATDAPAVVALPYDWNPHATPLAGWLGGHSQRGRDQGSGEAVLRKLLASGATGLEQVAEEGGVEWVLRLHARSTIHYQSHLVVARARDGKPVGLPAAL